MMNRDEIKAVYDRGPEAVIELVEHLFATIAQQQLQIASLTQRVSELEARLNTDSHNSNMPPSSDTFNKKTRSLRKRSKKKRGAQKGHDPHLLRQVDDPHRVITHRVEKCLNCQASLKDVASSDCNARQVFDLPQLKLEVTEHRAEVKVCPGCGTRCEGQFPAGVTNLTQYGETIKSFAVYLMNYQLLPYRRTREMMAEMVGQPIAEGSLQTALSQCFEGLCQTQQLIREGVLKAKLTHFDETGFYVEGKRQWLHVASTQGLTYYAHHEKRGCKAMDEIAILPRFKGIAQHDALHCYLTYPCEHALCNAHHLRELTYLEEQQHLKWAARMKRLLVEIKQAVEVAKDEAKSRLSKTEIEEYESRYEKILRQAYRIESRKPAPLSGRRGRKKQSKAKNLLDRLSRYRRETLRFMYDFEVPFDNNQAERDVRMMKVQQKISGSFRTNQGARIFCRIRSYISTMRKQGHNVLAALKSVFAGSPIVPALSG
jgi:transposase